MKPKFFLALFWIFFLLLPIALAFRGVSFQEPFSCGIALPPINLDQPIIQTFTTGKRPVTDLSFRIATYSRIFPNAINISLNKKDESAIVTSTIPSWKLWDNAFVHIPLADPLQTETAYQLHISQPNTQKPVSVWTSPTGCYSGKLTINGQGLNGDVILHQSSTSSDWTENMKTFLERISQFKPTFLKGHSWIVIFVAYLMATLFFLIRLLATTNDRKPKI